ncbi:MAG: 4Fe-4S dicluster domain-containing protein [Deltaproteobacteria bacterium]|nr:4Fe-4S dicluster domain-containing protein [Deltaproteobacteria bacterium]
MARTKITIDHEICGDGHKVDPRACGLCLRACPPAVFTLHQSFDIPEKDPYDPQFWRITVLWPTLCSRCMKCVEVCPEKAIRVS